MFEQRLGMIGAPQGGDKPAETEESPMAARMRAIREKADAPVKKDEEADLWDKLAQQNSVPGRVTRRAFEGDRPVKVTGGR